ncbi:ADP-ribosyltransferase [Mycobacterium sp. HNNTM2301]|uniref:ADP-ribosyltransferase n=1 Tax=Mycobacterium hainanense TaxID=3289775 RepID=UPI0035A6A731
MEGSHEPVSAPATGTPVAPGAALGDRTPSTLPLPAEDAPPRGPEPIGRPPTEPVPIVTNSPQSAFAVKSAPRAPASAGRETDLPGSASGPKGPGESGPTDGRSSAPLDANAQTTGKGSSPDGDRSELGAEADPGNPGGHLGPHDLGALADYTGPGYQDLNNALRSRLMDASQQARVQALKNALAKLPPYQGPVIRGTNLPPEVLARYRPGEVITEDAFLSTSTDLGVARSPTFAGNVEFRILSKTGREVSSFSVFPAEREVLFSAGTKFFIVSKVIDPLTGRTVIRMVER